MNKGWIDKHLLDLSGGAREFSHQVKLLADSIPPGAFASNTVSAQILSSPNLRSGIENLVQALLGDTTGDWFYGGWIDQAMPYVGMCRAGGAELLETMLQQIDADPLQEGGDQIVGFLKPDRDWYLAIETSPDDCSLTVVLNTESEHDANLARATANPHASS